MSRMSMLPPTLRGGTTLCNPGGGRQPDGAAERPQRHVPARPVERRRLARRVVFPQMQRRILEGIGEQAEARDVGGPAPARWREAQDRHLDRIARLGAVDIDRPVTGLTLPKSSPGTSATVDFIEICPPEASTVRNSTVSPGATTSRGGKALFQPK